MAKTTPTPIDLDDDAIKEIIGSIEDGFGELETLRAEYMNAAKGVRESISELKKDAKSRGIPLPALNATIRDRMLQQKRQKNVASLDGKNSDAFTQMSNALDDLDGTPLGNAAAKTAKPKSTKSAGNTKPSASAKPPPGANDDGDDGSDMPDFGGPEGAPDLAASSPDLG